MIENGLKIEAGGSELEEETEDPVFPPLQDPLPSLLPLLPATRDLLPSRTYLWKY